MPRHRPGRPQKKPKGDAQRESKRGGKEEKQPGRLCNAVRSIPAEWRLSGGAGKGRKAHEEIAAENAPKSNEKSLQPTLSSTRFKINTKRWTLRHSMVKLLETKNKAKS